MQLFRAVDRALHPGRAGGEHQFRTVGGQQFAPLNAHRFGHGEDQPVAFDRGGKGEADSGVAAGRFDDQRTGFEQAARFGVLDHRESDAILDAAARIEIFHLRQHVGFAVVEAVNAKQRRAADQLIHRRINTHKIAPFAMRRSGAGCLGVPLYCTPK